MRDRFGRLVLYCVELTHQRDARRRSMPRRAMTLTHATSRFNCPDVIGLQSPVGEVIPHILPISNRCVSARSSTFFLRILGFSSFQPESERALRYAEQGESSLAALSSGMEFVQRRSIAQTRSTSLRHKRAGFPSSTTPESVVAVTKTSSPKTEFRAKAFRASHFPSVQAQPIRPALTCANFSSPIKRREDVPMSGSRRIDRTDQRKCEKPQRRRDLLRNNRAIRGRVALPRIVGRIRVSMRERSGSAYQRDDPILKRRRLLPVLQVSAPRSDRRSRLL